jgi:hypothetical protein
MLPVICPYCSEKARLVFGSELYPTHQRLALKQFWVCEPCDARVGLHADGRPLGTMANARLRRMRRRVHDLLDPLWLQHADKGKARRRAYSRLAHALGIPVEDCHVGEFRDGRCARALEILERGEVMV